MKKFSPLTFFIIIIGFCVAVSCGSLLSNALISTGIITNMEISTPQCNFFAISTANCQKSEDLNEQKNFLQQNTGAGYVKQLNETFYLLSGVYANKADAELVKNNLSQNIECEILTIAFPKIKIDGNFNSNERLVLSNCVNSQTSIYTALYDVAISLDTGVFDLEKAKLQCNTIYSNSISTKANFETFFKNKTEKNDDLKQLYEILQNNEKCLSNLVSEQYESENQTFSSLIKLTYCKILFQ